MQIENSLEAEAKSIYFFFKSKNARKNWFLVPNISKELKKRIEESEFEKVREDIISEFSPFYEKYKNLIEKREKKVKEKMGGLKSKTKCFLCISISNGMFDAENKEIYVTLNRPIDEIIHIIKHEVAHIENWDRTKNMSFKEREKFIEDVLNQ